MPKLNLYRIVKYGNNPLTVLVFACSRQEGKDFVEEKYGPQYMEAKFIKVERGLVLTEVARR